MLTQIALENFKSFKQAELPLGPFTVLVGTNASGKSNIRDAFRFLHGISLGCSLTEMLEEKRIEGGWKGIRGGINEICHSGENFFSVETEFCLSVPLTKSINRNPSIPEDLFQIQYSLVIQKNLNQTNLEITSEKLIRNGIVLYSTSEKNDNSQISASTETNNEKITSEFSTSQPILSQIINDFNFLGNPYVSYFSIKSSEFFESLRFLDFDPEAMKVPSLPRGGFKNQKLILLS